MTGEAQPPRIAGSSGMQEERALSPASTAPALSICAPGGVSMTLPAVIAEAGESAARHTLEFFTARIPNAHTRKA